MDRIIWSPSAVADLESIHEFISRDSPNYAAELVEDLLAGPYQLLNFPRIGRVVPGFGQEQLRELLIGSYRVVYELFSDRIEIVGVIHGRRDMPSALLDPE